MMAEDVFVDDLQQERHHTIKLLNYYTFSITHSLTNPKLSANSYQNEKQNMKFFLKKLLSISGNEKCADCGCEDAKWTSLNLGIIICIECSGVHRSLGVHFSKVR
jgi:hypothetical protein